MTVASSHGVQLPAGVPAPDAAGAAPRPGDPQADAALRQAQQRLLESSWRFELALAATHMGDWSWDGSTDVVTLGPRAADIFGIERGVPITWTAMRDLLHPDDRERARLAVEQAIATRTDYDIEYRVQRPSGEAAWVAARGRATYAPGGELAGMIGLVQDVSAAKRAEQALRDSEQRLRATFAQAAVGIAIAGLDGCFQDMNRRFATLLGYAQEELRGMNFNQITHPDDQARTTENVRRLLDGATNDYAMEKRYVRKDGSVFWSRTTVTVVRDAGGAPLQFIGVIDDISQRRRVEEELRQSEEFSRSIIESSRDCIKTLDRHGRLLWMSDTGLRALSIADGRDAVGRSWLELWTGDDRRAAERALEQACAGALGHFVGRFDVAGEERWWDVAISPVQGGGGAERLLAVSRDVTQRIAADRALREETRILELLNHAGQQVASRLDVEQIVQTVTDSATALAGAHFGAFFYNTVDENGAAYMLYTLSGAPREAFERFGHPRATPLFGPTFRGEGIVRRDDITADPLYGQWSPHHGMPQGHLPVRSYLAVPVVSRSGEVLGGLFLGHPEPGVFNERAERLVAGVAAQAAVAIDNARLLEAERRSARERERLLESERAARAEVERLSATKDDFLATLSHELRTPLSSIVGWSQLLRRENATPEEARRAAEVIERNARIQAQLIEDLLDMSRITSGKMRLDVQQILPFTCVEAAVESMRPAAQAKGVRLEVLVDPLAGPVSGDPGRLQQVIWNLLSNAVKFTPREGKVQVRLARVNSHVEITVSDTGAGIAPEFLPHVFERFRQADASTTRQHGGLGLGLAIVRHLVDLHGGTVTARSPGPGRGATFCVELPVTVVHSAPAEPERAHPRAPRAAEFVPADLAGIRVLVVDDELDGRDLVARVLRDCHAEVTVAGSAAQALDAVRTRRPHVLVSDIGMPEMDGYELLRQVRALDGEAGGRVPAIALTAFARSEDRTRALRAGYLAHLAKPVEAAELVATVASIVGRVEQPA